MRSDAQTVHEYLESLPDERRDAVTAVRNTVLENLQPGFEEGMQFGMIGYYVPLERYPKTYNGQPLSYVSIASQKNHIAIYLMCLYSDPGEEARFREAWEQTGKKLNMGKSCVRFRKLDDVPLDIIGNAVSSHSVDDYIRRYEQSRA
ncbi:MAG TPA: DUF1801 domain-containing protein [Thermomicrobiales bacterium]|nr:DUF1801 domain-containing protein [Thermomicrobiales bacterium]